jgi:DNA damage-binding protein 1
LVSLDSSTLFIGSHFADSLTVSLHPNLHPKQTIITNLAPISDFLVLPPSHPQAGALITCSGGFGQGTLRVVRQGVGIEDYASVDFEGIRGVWTIATVVNGMAIDGPPRDGVLVLGLIERTVFLEMDNEGGLEAVETVGGLIGDEETIALKETEGRIVQITTEQVLVTAHGAKVSGFPGKVSAAQITGTKILISSGRVMQLLTLNCAMIRQWTLTEEITCLAIHDEIIAVGLWNSTVQLISLKEDKIVQIDSALSAPARSIVLTDILPTLTLLIGSRDGTLTTYSLPPSSPPTDKKTVSLGTQPLRLFPLNTHSRNLIFASSDRPTLLHAPVKRDGSKKLVLSALSLRDVLSLTPLEHPAYQDSLVIATKEGFRIGKMDQMSRLQVRSVGMPGGELPRRIARMDAQDIATARGGSLSPVAGVVGVISLKVSFEMDGSERTEGLLRVWDEESWQCICF